MSAALLRRGLELLGAPEGEEGLAGDAQRGRRTAGAAGRSPEAPRAAPGQAKPSGAPAKRTRKAKATQAQKLRNSAKGKVPKDALAEFQKREHRGYLGVNLKFMTSARTTVAESVTRQIVRQNRGRKACDRPVAKTKKKKAEGTVFTEEDFQKFQQEYFGS
ncbi:active regulator of SIRT1 isoform X2 [Ailuropoda melanoleuca]|uniref:active regulator of SIRT1 isoform X2 n=1 Tax=Ailuropoda melanoleuca TaxID=9646 RepID=UPI0014944F63|nr:active regulator of SIRT1 isoform X2 [Ailuropoda melanoleuca]